MRFVTVIGYWPDDPKEKELLRDQERFFSMKNKLENSSAHTEDMYASALYGLRKEFLEKYGAEEFDKHFGNPMKYCFKIEMGEKFNSNG